MFKIFDEIRNLENSIDAAKNDIINTFEEQQQAVNDKIIETLGKAYITAEEGSGFDGKIILDIVEQQTINYQNSITEHTVEDGSRYVDHITNGRRQVQMTGIIANITYKIPTYAKAIQQASNKMGIVSKYAPALTSGLQQNFNDTFVKVQEGINFASGILESAKSFYDLLKNISQANSKVGKAFHILDGVMMKKAVGKLELKTGGMSFDKMAIKDCKVVFKTKEYGAEAMFIDLTFEEIPIAEVKKTIIKKPAKAPIDNTRNVNKSTSSGKVNTKTTTKLQSQLFIATR